MLLGGDGRRVHCCTCLRPSSVAATACHAASTPTRCSTHPPASTLQQQPASLHWPAPTCGPATSCRPWSRRSKRWAPLWCTRGCCWRATATSTAPPRAGTRRACTTSWPPRAATRVGVVGWVGLERQCELLWVTSREGCPPRTAMLNQSTVFLVSLHILPVGPMTSPLKLTCRPPAALLCARRQRSCRCHGWRQLVWVVSSLHGCWHWLSRGACDCLPHCRTDVGKDLAFLPHQQAF